MKSEIKKLKEIIEGHEMMASQYIKTIEEMDDELEACAEKNQDKKEKIEAVLELINDYRFSEDHTLARAHITLFKIDMDVLRQEHDNSIFSASLRRDQE